MKKQKGKKKKREFSKILVGQESALIWIMTLAFIGLAYICIEKQYFGELPWLSAMIAFPWTAYGVSQGFYYNKAKMENKLKIEKSFTPDQENLQEEQAVEPDVGQTEPFEGM